MDITKFLNSKDIREHLQAMDYSFDAVTAAYLVWQCHNATLEEKFSAWEEIAKTMPDCPIPRRPGMADDVPSVHQFLRDYIGLEKNRLEHFTQGENCVFGADFSSCPTRSGERKAFGRKAILCSQTIQAVSPIVGKNSPKKLARCGFGSRY